MSVLSIGLSLIKVAGVAGRTVLKLLWSEIETNWESETRNWEDVE